MLLPSILSVLTAPPRTAAHLLVALFRRIPPPPAPPPGKFHNIGMLKVLREPDPAMHNMDIIFFHGLELSHSYEHAYYWTWATDKPDSVCWPIHLLPQDCPGARILSVHYNTLAEANHGQMSLEALAGAVLQDLQNAHVGRKGGPQAVPVPVVLVGHSLGGIVLKQVCIQASELAIQQNGYGGYMQEYAKHFLQHVRMVAFFSTPHNGSQLATLAGAAMRSSPVLKLLAPYNRDAAVNNAAFQLLRHNTRLGIDWNVFQLHETVAMGALGLETLVVSEASGRAGVDQHRFQFVPNTDHISICQLSKRTDSQYRTFIENIKTIEYQWVEVRGNNFPAQLTYGHGLDSGGISASRQVFIARHCTPEHNTPGTAGRHFKSITYELSNRANDLPPTEPYHVLHTPYFKLFFQWVPMTDIKQCVDWANATQRVHITERRPWIDNAFDISENGEGLYIVRPRLNNGGPNALHLRGEAHLPLCTDTCFGKVMEGFDGIGAFALPVGPCRLCTEMKFWVLRWDEMEVLMRRA